MSRAAFALLVAAAVASVAALPWVVRDYYDDVRFSPFGWRIALALGIPNLAVFGWAASIELRGGNRRALAWAAAAAGAFEAFIEFWPGAFALWVLAVLEALLSRRAR
jgi:hypothetical protein